MRAKPIGNLDRKRDLKKNYRNYPINAIDEGYKDLREFSIEGENYYYKKNNPPYFESIKHSIPNLFVRDTVLEKLQSVNTKLKKFGLELYVFDSYRPIEVQNYMHDVWCPNYFKKLYPEISKEELENKVNDFWAFGGEINPLSPPPHNTGAAIDLTLVNTITGNLLEMGTKFDELNDKTYTDYYENKKELNDKEKIIRDNRRILFWAMKDEGFENNPTEWWHFSYGDQMWAKLQGKEYAIYSNLAVLQDV